MNRVVAWRNAAIVRAVVGSSLKWKPIQKIDVGHVDFRQVLRITVRATNVTTTASNSEPALPKRRACGPSSEQTTAPRKDSRSVIRREVRCVTASVRSTETSRMPRIARLEQPTERWSAHDDGLGRVGQAVALKNPLRESNGSCDSERSSLTHEKSAAHERR
jgi:hypothetical protein